MIIGSIMGFRLGMMAGPTSDQDSGGRDGRYGAGGVNRYRNVRVESQSDKPSTVVMENPDVKTAVLSEGCHW